MEQANQYHTISECMLSSGGDENALQTLEEVVAESILYWGQNGRDSMAVEHPEGGCND